MNKTLISYAQNREDLILYVILHSIKKGFYVDVGTNDPVIDSVTKFFYDRGWSGINIEPIESIYNSIKDNRKRDINLNIGISDKEGELLFREYGNGKHGWSTLSNNTKEQHDKESVYKDYKVKVATLKSVFDQQKVKEIDFLKIDVEGFEYEVLSGNDWVKYRPKVIVIEDTNPEKWIHLIKSVNYTQVYHDGLNRYFVRNDLPESFSIDYYKDVLLSGAVIKNARESVMEERLVNLNKWLKEAQKALRASRKETILMQSRLDNLSQDPASYFGIKTLSAALIKRITMKLAKRSPR